MLDGSEDWDLLLNAVATRLRASVAARPESLAQDRLDCLQADVLDCVLALEQLHQVFHQRLVMRSK